VKDCIQDFISAWKAYDASEDRHDRDWNIRFKEAGYYSAMCGSGVTITVWQQIHQWCEKQYGANHFAWRGSRFWFETERDALLFILRWS